MIATDSEKQELCKKMWSEHRDELQSLCERKLNSCRGEIDDIIADAFYYLCVAVFNDKIHTNARAWLFAVTKNLIKKKYTEIKNKKQHHISFEEENMDKYDIYKFDDDLLLDGIVSESIIESMNIDIIDNLTPTEQQLYKYVYEDKLSMKQIAEKMNLTENATKQRNYRLSKKIKILVKEYIENL